MVKLLLPGREHQSPQMNFDIFRSKIFKVRVRGREEVTRKLYTKRFVYDSV